MKTRCVLWFCFLLALCSLLLPAGAQPVPLHGAWVYWYDDELFTTPDTGALISTVDLSGTRNYDAAVITGYLSVSNTAVYDLRLESYPRGEFIFDGTMVGSALGPAGACAPGGSENRVLSSRQLVAGQYYPFQLRLRTGCALYTYLLRLHWRLLGTGTYSIVPTQNLFASLPPAVTNTPSTIYHAVEICWPTETAHYYQAQWASALDTNTWYKLGGEVLGNGSTNCVFDTTRTAEKRFYRVLSWQ